MKQENVFRHFRWIAAKDSADFGRWSNENTLRQPQRFCNAKRGLLFIFKMRYLIASYFQRCVIFDRSLPRTRPTLGDDRTKRNESTPRQPQRFCNAKRGLLLIFKMRHLIASYSKRCQFKLKKKQCKGTISTNTKSRLYWMSLAAVWNSLANL